MSSISRVTALSLALVLVTWGTASADRSGPRAGRGQQVFEQVLAGRGEWRDVAPYGRVWRPNVRLVGETFTPYASGGRWTYTELGWTFESDWDWGWVPFHYGRWAMTGDAGWVWVPGNEWAPAWVDWRAGNGWVGWAPLAPGARRVEEGDAGWSFIRLRDFAAGELPGRAVARGELAQMHRLTAPVRVLVPRQRWYEGPPPRWQSSAGEVVVTPAQISAPRRGRIERARIERTPRD